MNILFLFGLTCVLIFIYYMFFLQVADIVDEEEEYFEDNFFTKIFMWLSAMIVVFLMYKMSPFEQTTETFGGNYDYNHSDNIRYASPRNSSGYVYYSSSPSIHSSPKVSYEKNRPISQTSAEYINARSPYKIPSTEIPYRSASDIEANLVIDVLQKDKEDQHLSKEDKTKYLNDSDSDETELNMSNYYDDIDEENLSEIYSPLKYMYREENEDEEDKKLKKAEDGDDEEDEEEDDEEIYLDDPIGYSPEYKNLYDEFYNSPRTSLDIVKFLDRYEDEDDYETHKKVLSTNKDESESHKKYFDIPGHLKNDAWDSDSKNVYRAKTQRLKPNYSLEDSNLEDVVWSPKKYTSQNLNRTYKPFPAPKNRNFYDKKMQPTANMFIKQTRPEQSKTSRVESRSAKDKIAKFF
uniref:Uncharacterized protein n=1 Tax=viral metagenome TaxID=1070528 RepID=A0A6C0JC26_9ZZZZ